MQRQCKYIILIQKHEFLGLLRVRNFPLINPDMQSFENMQPTLHILKYLLIYIQIKNTLNFGVCNSVKLRQAISMSQLAILFMISS